MAQLNFVERKGDMKRRLLMSTVFLAVFTVTDAGVWADIPEFVPEPHGMLSVRIDENDKIFSNSGAANFSLAETGIDRFTANERGQTILWHDLGAEFGDGTVILGGLAERDGESVFNQDPATRDTTLLRADDPGYFIGAGAFPERIRLSLNLHNSLRYFGPGATHWTAPPNGETLRVYDLTNKDNTVADNEPDELRQDLEVFITGESLGKLGTISLATTGRAPFPGQPAPGIHAHVGYELSQPDEQRPAFGAYMIELTLSGREYPGPEGVVLEDSDPIFVVFDNQSNEHSEDLFEDAVAAAEALPMPGDANGDSRVDASDLNELALSWQQSVEPRSGADFNGDGFIDAADLNELALNWQFGVPPGSLIQTAFAEALSDAQALPEPTSLVSVMAAWLGLLGWRRPSRC